MSFLHFFLQRDHIIIIYNFFFFFFFLQRRHLLDNLDDKPADETERALVKNKISFPYYFFILTHRASLVSGPLHRLAKELSAFWSA